MSDQRLIDDTGGSQLHRVVSPQRMALEEFSGKINDPCLSKNDMVLCGAVGSEALDQLISFVYRDNTFTGASGKCTGHLCPCDIRDAADDLVFIGRPDIAVASTPEAPGVAPHPVATSVTVLDVDVPMQDEVSENFLEIHEVKTGNLVTVLELLSPVNKLHRQGREAYERKRSYIFRTWTNLVEIDLLRAGEPMSVVGAQVQSDYRILVSRGLQRPHASLIVFNLRHPIPAFTLPLLPGDDEPEVAMNGILHALYRRARFDLRLDCTQPPIPPLPAADAAWAQALMTVHEFTLQRPPQYIRERKPAAPAGRL